MGEEIVEKVTIKGDSTSAQKAAKKAENALLKSFFKASLAADAAKKAFSFVTAELKEGVEAAIENEKTTVRLQTALRMQGYDVARNVKLLNEQSAALESITNISDEVLRKYQAQAINLGVATEEADKYVRASILLAEITGRDVNTAFEQVIKSTSGVAEETLKLIPEIRTLTKEELAAGKAADILVQQYSDLIDVGSRGASGTLATLTTATANLKEEVGLAIVKNETFIKITSDLADGAQDLADAISKDGLTAAFEALAKASTAALRPLELIFPYLAGLRILNEQMREQGTEVGVPAALERPGLPTPGPFAPGQSPEELEAARVRARRQASRAGIEREKKPKVQILALDPEVGEVGKVQQVSDDIVKIIADKKEKIAEIEKAKNEEIEAIEHAARQKALESHQMHEQQKLQIATTFANATANAALGALDLWLQGEKVVGAKIVVEFAKGLGRQLIMRGLFDVAQGIARTYFSYGSDGTGPALIAHGKTEIALGGLMMGGGAAIASLTGQDFRGKSREEREQEAEEERERKRIERQEKRDREREDKRSGDATAFGRDDTERASTTGEDGGITIIFNGPTTAAAVGVEINQALGAAREQGLIGG